RSGIGEILQLEHRRIPKLSDEDRVHYLLSRGAPPPLADAVVCKRWRACRPAWPQAPFTVSRGSFPTRVGPHPHTIELKAAPARWCRCLQALARLQTGMAAGADARCYHGKLNPNMSLVRVHKTVGVKVGHVQV